MTFLDPVMPDPEVWETRWAQVARKGNWRVMQERLLPGVPLPLRFWHRPSPVAGAPSVLLSAGIHGDEPAGPEALLQLAEQETDGPRINAYVAPLLNPGGWLKQTRENLDGIDLNRDFKHRASAEVRAYIAWVEQLSGLDLHLSLHEDWEYDGGYLYEINTSDRPSLAEPLLEAMRAETGLLEAPLIDGHCPCAPGFIQHEAEPDEPEGWPEAIYLVRRQPLLSYTAETPSQQPLARRVSCHQAIIKTVASLV